MPTAATIRSMADQLGVAYQRTAVDDLANHITRLSDDDVVLDETELLLVALQRAGHLTRREAVLMQADYLRQRQ